MADWQKMKKLGNRYKLQIKRLLCRYLYDELIYESGTDEDQKQGIDYITSRISFAARIRKFEDLQYSGELTLRNDVVSCNMTEVEKFLYDIAKADYYFYGFENKEKNDLCYWSILHVPVIKKYLISHYQIKQKPFSVITNSDGESSFITLKLNDIRNVFVATSGANT